MKNKIKNFFKKLLEYCKRPSFFIPFIITWTLFQVPWVVTGIAYLVTKEGKYLAICTSYIALTFPALPIPVVPISAAVGSGVERLVYLIKNRRKK